MFGAFQLMTLFPLRSPTVLKRGRGALHYPERIASAMIKSSFSALRRKPYLPESLDHAA